MTIDTLLALFTFALVGAITPGPNNVMLLASGANFGFRRTLPHILGIQVGFVSLSACIGLGLGTLLATFPALHLVLKVAGGAYLLYLAWRIATSRSAAKGEGAARPISFTQAALFQWINPKAWVVSISAVAIYLTPEHLSASIVGLVACFFLAGSIASPVWTAFGQSLRVFLSDATRLKWFNLVMGLLLVLTLVPMLD
ncbi:LysE family translocator [Pararhizobium mangrovi]|uniref:LysE family translocator n=1 Tax=Pararhizobium mangrovi TaxID=2590452 RepID=A0A506UHW4_9HYPH|nr:LysE family translocator [Pararhizobium mangrovi]TPW32914.1 LysE family translocator [Pararhizobium mangrovi]